MNCYLQILKDNFGEYLQSSLGYLAIYFSIDIIMVTKKILQFYNLPLIACDMTGLVYGGIYFTNFWPHPCAQSTS